MVRNKHLGRNFRGADHTLSPSLWDHNKHNRVIALVNFRPRQCVLCWLLLWLRCPLTVSPPILLCQLPVLCRARGVDCVGCEPKPGWESKTHTLTHTVHLPIVCQFHNFPTSVSEADGTCATLHHLKPLSDHAKVNTWVPSEESLWLESPAPAPPAYPSPPTPVPCAGHEAWLTARTSSVSPFSPRLIGSNISKQAFEQTV